MRLPVTAPPDRDGNENGGHRLRATARNPIWLLSLTWAMANVLKPKNKDGRARVIRFLNWTYFLLSVFIVVFVGFYCGDSLAAIRPEGLRWWAVLLQYVIMWRFFEVFFAFYRDAFAKLEEVDSSSNLRWSERVGLALRSYLELVLDFALVYALLPKSAWLKPEPEKLSDLVWYSANVITTSGGGGFLPGSIPLRLLSLCEIFCGVLLLVVCFTIYTSRALGELQSAKRT